MADDGRPNIGSRKIPEFLVLLSSSLIRVYTHSHTDTHTHFLSFSFPREPRAATMVADKTLKFAR